jgi:HNH endonuclease
MICSVEICERRAYARGLCFAHYTRLRRTGDIRADLPLNPTAAERFWRRVQKTDGCWLWTGAITQNGHGQFGNDSVVVYAHRFAYEELVGEIAPGHVLHHKCLNGHCVNPEHLVEMTQSDHIRLHFGYGVE